MADLFSKKEKHLWLIFQWITLIVSLFAALMAYNASISATKLSWTLNKANEIESRLYQQKFDLYKKITDELSKIYIENSSEMGFSIQANNLLTFLKINWSTMRVIWGKEAVFHYNCLIENLNSFIIPEALEEDRDIYMEIERWSDYNVYIAPSLYLLENAMRFELKWEYLPALWSLDHEPDDWWTKDICNKQLEKITPYSLYNF